jgi:hypothetical protein
MATPYLILTTNDSHTHTFANHNAIVDWLKLFRQFYKFEKIEVAGLQPNIVTHFLNLLFTQVSPHIESLTNTLSVESFNYNKILAEQEAKKIFERRLLIDPASKLGLDISKLRATDPLAAFYALCLFHNVNAAFLAPAQNGSNPGFSSSLAKAIALFSFANAGISDGIDSIKADYEGFRLASESRINEFIHAATTNWSVFSTKSEQTLNDLMERGNAINQGYDGLSEKILHLDSEVEDRKRIIHKSETDLNDFLSETNERFNSLVAAFEARVKTDSAIKYWKKKHTAHTWWTAGILATMVGFAYTTYKAALWLKHHLPTTLGFENLPYWVPFAFLLFLVGVVWAGRIFVRILLSQINLREDAGERATMAQTYIALVKEGAANNSDHMAIVLQALFRPSSKGLGADDGSPQLPLEIVMKRLSGDGGS